MLRPLLPLWESPKVINYLCAVHKPTENRNSLFGNVTRLARETERRMSPERSSLEASLINEILTFKGERNCCRPFNLTFLWHFPDISIHVGVSRFWHCPCQDLCYGSHVAVWPGSLCQTLISGFFYTVCLQFSVLPVRFSASAFLLDPFIENNIKIPKKKKAWRQKSAI